MITICDPRTVGEAMKILVLSDSHSALSFMRMCIDRVQPQVVIHLGDYYEDGQTMAEEFSHIRFYCVPGNCDHYRVDSSVPQTLVETVDGVKIYMTHGHLHRVKSGTEALISSAQRRGAKIALFGHTHAAVCWQEEDGLWVLNPGSCGYYGGSAGLLQTESGKILSCRIIRQADLEEML